MFRCALACPVSQHRADTGQQLSEAKRLGDVVVVAQFEPDHAIDLVATLTCRDDDGDVGLCAYLAKQIEPVLLAEPQVENHQIRLAARQQSNHLVGPAGGHRPEVMILEIVRHQMPHPVVVLDHEVSETAMGETPPELRLADEATCRPPCEKKGPQNF
jgi:hypothetical protein